MSHTFHIPVLGLGFSIDTPLKVARYGISSVVSVVDDELIERMRQFHLNQNGLDFTPIKVSEPDFRAKRITAYLNLLQELIDKQIGEGKKQPFSAGSDITRYFELLPDHSAQKAIYLQMLDETDENLKSSLQHQLRNYVSAGSIDANIMSKVDKLNFNKDGTLPDDKFSDALSALRGFANSTLNSSLILSAGMNPRLYGYIEEFADFFPAQGLPAKKKLILKVSDFRSAFIQAKFLAKKGVWVHEFRIESGLNCGGHAFATEGLLLGPILEEFKEKRQSMAAELLDAYRDALEGKGIRLPATAPLTRITVQGGIGTVEEDIFLKEYYQLDGTGWGSPFLLVPEATNVDEATLAQLVRAEQEDFYISGASPLGIPFNNFRKSTAELQRLDRIAKGRPGSPCTKKYLVSNTEFSKEPICTASREYQNLKLKQLAEQKLHEDEYSLKAKQITEKMCLCQGLSSSAYIKNEILKPRENRAVAICPGPNTAYFKGVFSLEEMVAHIYGRRDLLEGVGRPHVFINELKLYIDYLKKDIESNLDSLTDKKIKQLERFKGQLMHGINYYIELPGVSCKELFNAGIESMMELLNKIQIPVQNPSLQS